MHGGRAWWIAASATTLVTVMLGCPGKSTPLTPPAVTRMNDAAARVGQFDFKTAEAEFAALSLAFPDNEDLLFNIAVARMNQSEEGSQADALEQLRGLMVRSPANLRAQYAAALCLLYLGKPEESAPLFEGIAKQRPSDAYAAYFAGASLDAMDKHAEALVYFQQAATLEPHLKSAWLGVQRCARRLGDEALADSALATFETLLEHPRALTAEFKYTRMGELALVALPSEPESVARKTANWDGCFAAVEPLVIESESASVLHWGADLRASAVTVDLNDDGLQDLVLLRAFATAGTDLPPNAVLLASPRGSYTLDRTHAAAMITEVNALLVGDIDNDTEDDLYFCREGSNVLLMRDAEGKYRDRTAAFGVAGSGSPTVDGSLADLDQDGDLDLFLVHSSGKNELLANNLDGTFRALGVDQGLAFDDRPSRQVLVTDIDQDRDVDIVVLKASAPHEVWMSDRVWKWSRSNAYDAFEARPALGVVAVDAFSSATRSLLTLNASTIAKFDPQARAWSRTLETARGGEPEALSISDVNGDGLSDLIEQHSGCTVIRDANLEALHTITAPLGTTTSYLFALDPVKGDALLYLRKGAGPMIARAGKSRMQFAAVQLRGRDDVSQSMRSNASGLGASFVARVGNQWTGGTMARTSSRAGQSLAPIPFGLGNAMRADFIEIDWSDGVMQTERAIRAGEIARITETQRQLSSCPVLFACNGERMEFVTDLLGVGGLGYLLEPGVYSEPRPNEVLVLPEGSLAATDDGMLRIALAEPMEESCMLDALTLEAIDLPNGWEIAPDERLGIFGAPPTGEIVAWKTEWLPTSEPALRLRDGVAKELPAHDRRFIGRLASEYTVDLAFEADITQLQDPWLIIDGWVEYPYCQTMFAAWQAGAKFRAPSLEARAADGTWKELVSEWGYPAGMPRRMALPIARLELPEGCRQLRMRTNMEIYFDAIRLIEREALPNARVSLPLASASLTSVGFAKRTTSAQARPFYDHAQPLPLWDCRFQRGLYSEFGDVQTLLDKDDNALVVFGPGEEVACAFVAPALPAAVGTTRRFVLTTRGWCKDMDLFTRDGETIEPLPSKGSRSDESAQLMQRTRTRWMGGR
ncbi:MAG: hypothetical protein EXS10_04650 [Phycisphaerales bacterium]|nr:hypothetical protein [Phycisphaerales bacterium]